MKIFKGAESLLREITSCFWKIFLRRLSWAESPEGFLRQDPRQVLVLRVDRIGDLIVSTPFFRAFRRRYPHARVVALVSSMNAVVLERSPDLDEVWVFSWRNLGKILWRLWRCRFDLVVDLNPAYSLTSGLLARFSRSGVRVSYRCRDDRYFYNFVIDPGGEKEHMLEKLERMARALGLERLENRYRVYPSVGQEREAQSKLAELGWRQEELWIGIHPGNVKKFDNRWPERKFSELADRIILETGAKLLFIQGPGEEFLIRNIMEWMTHKGSRVLEPLPLLTTAAVLSRLKLLICNSTSLLHLAAAMGTPTLCLSSQFNYYWRPLGPQHSIVMDTAWNSCRAIPAGEVFTVVKSLLSKNLMVSRTI